MSKADKVLDLFPVFYRASDPNKLLSEVARQMAQPLEEADTHVFRIQRAHRLLVAEHTEDIVRLAAALNLTPFHFEDLLTSGIEYEQRLAMMRERVQRIAAIHLRGLGTPWAVLEATAIFLNAALMPDKTGDPLIKRIDPDGFSHRVTIEYTHLPERPRAQLALHENPLRRQKVEPEPRWPMDSWAIENRTVAPAPAIFAIEGVSDHTVLPSLFCAETEEGLLFEGIVPAGKTLVIDAEGGALLDGHPVEDWLRYFRGGIFDISSVDNAPFVEEQGGREPPFDGDLAALISPPYRQRRPVPAARVGRSTWYFTVAVGVYDGSVFDYATFATPEEGIGVYDADNNFDGCVFDYPASGVVGMAWDERIPCAFKLALPPSVPEPSSGEESEGRAGTPVNYLGRVSSLLPRFKAAGVRGYVDTARDAWVLGQSVLRAPDATEGEGITSQATRLQNARADSYVPLDAPR